MSNQLLRSGVDTEHFYLCTHTHGNTLSRQCRFSYSVWNYKICSLNTIANTCTCNIAPTFYRNTIISIYLSFTFKNIYQYDLLYSFCRGLDTYFEGHRLV